MFLTGTTQGLQSKTDHCSVTASKVAAYLPGISTISGFAELIIKHAVIKDSATKASRHPYYTYLHAKKTWHIAVILIPGLGNLVMLVVWCIQKLRRKELPSSERNHQVENEKVVITSTSPNLALNSSATLEREELGSSPISRPDLSMPPSSSFDDPLQKLPQPPPHQPILLPSPNSCLPSPSVPESLIPASSLQESLPPVSSTFTESDTKVTQESYPIQRKSAVQKEVVSSETSEIHLSLALLYSGKRGDEAKDIKKMFMHAKQAYELNKGNVAAVLMMGEYYTSGIPGELLPNIAEARRVLLEAYGIVRAFKASQDENFGLSSILLALGDLHLLYPPNQKSLEDAIGYYKEADRLGEVYATTRLAACHALGRGVERNTTRARTLFRNASQHISQQKNQSNIIFPESLNTAEVPSGKIADLEKYYAEHSVPKIALDLALCYQLGHQVPLSDVEALKWYEAAAKGDGQESRLATLYRDALNTLLLSQPHPNTIPQPPSPPPSNPEIQAPPITTVTPMKVGKQQETSDVEAVFQSANQLLEAQHSGSFPNMVSLYKKAALNHHTLAIHRLAEFHLEGYAVKKDLKLGFQYAQRAHELDPGNVDIVITLAYCYQLGRGAEPDIKRSRELLEGASKCNNDHPGLNLALGDQYLLERFKLEQDLLQQESLGVAMASGYSQALTGLGIKAITHYEKAQAGGSIHAVVRLALISAFYVKRGEQLVRTNAELKETRALFEIVKTSDGMRDFPYRVNPFMSSSSALRRLQEGERSVDPSPEALVDLALSYQLGYKTICQSLSKAEELYETLCDLDYPFARLYLTVFRRLHPQKEVNKLDPSKKNINKKNMMTIYDL